MKHYLEDAISTNKIPWDRLALLEQMPAGGARNSIDCALWDLEAREQRRRVWELAGVAEPRALRSTYTICLAEPSKMVADVGFAPPGAVLKLKLGARDGRTTGSAPSGGRPRV